jgi:hypothetical protein
MAVDTGLEVVASEQENPGYVTFGVMYNGAFYPIGMQKLGHHDSFAGSPTSQEVADSRKSKRSASKSKSSGSQPATDDTQDAQE